MGVKKCYTIAVVLILAIIIIGVYLFTHPKRPLFRNDAKKISQETTPSPLPKEPKRIKKPGITQDSLSQEPQDTKIITFNKTSLEPLASLNKGTIHLSTLPKELTIETIQGQNGEGNFKLTNNSNTAAYLNIYKALSTNKTDYEDQITYYLNHKNSVINDNPTEELLRSASLFTGTPWIRHHPYYLILGPGETRTINVSIFGRELKPQEYRSALIIVGMNREETLILPVKVKVKEGPKIRFEKLAIDDGISPKTRGNTNRCADPGELIEFTVSLKNIGAASAEGLTISANADPAFITFLSNTKVDIPYAASGENIYASFFVEIASQDHPPHPCPVTIITTEKTGAQWEENFYLGEPGKFEYPTGVKLDALPKEVVQRLTKGELKPEE